MVEAVALCGRDRARRCASGSGRASAIGTVGLAAEWAWSHVWMPLPVAVGAVPRGGAARLRGGARRGRCSAPGSAPASRPSRGRRRRLRAGRRCRARRSVAAADRLRPLHAADEGVSAQRRAASTSTRRARPRQSRPRCASPRPTRPTDAEWLDVTAWQGGGLVVDPLTRIGPGHYRTTEPIPVHGDWKTMIRLHKGNSLTALPIYLPARRGDPGRRGPGPRELQPRLRRRARAPAARAERRQPGRWSRSPTRSSPAIALALLALLAWGLHRLARSESAAPPSRSHSPAPAQPGGASR